jgi:hypothetical protein
VTTSADEQKSMTERRLSLMKSVRGFPMFLSVVLSLTAWTSWAMAGVPDVTRSYYVPQVGPYPAPTEGNAATSYFHACPNNDGGSSLPLSARVMIVVKDAAGLGIPGIAPADIYMAFNGGTPVQGFTGFGADSIIANGTYNTAPPCPNVQHVQADGPTDGNGITYITFTGPGGVRDPFRKWGHYDSEIPVYVLGLPLSGRITSDAENGTYTLRIKNFDVAGGLSTALNQGEMVNSTDANTVTSSFLVDSFLSYWRDFDSQCGVSLTDYNMVYWHINHNCGFPNNP